MKSYDVLEYLISNNINYYLNNHFLLAIILVSQSIPSKSPSPTNAQHP
jgi:hypothetical protein